MARYIDADAIMPKVIESEKFIFRKEDVYECRELVFKTCYEDLEDIICKIPTADVVEVVRCKDCRYYKHTVIGDQMACVRQTAYKKPTDYCSYGERKCDNG